MVENFLENYHSFYSGPAHKQLSDVIDQDSYRWSIEGKVIEFLGRGGTAEKLPYEMLGRAATSPGATMAFRSSSCGPTWPSSSCRAPACCWFS